MKLSNTDSILLFNLIILVLILGYLIYKLEYESGIFIKNDVVSRFCNEQKKHNKELKGLLANKIRIKEYNKKYFPELKCAKTLYVFDLKNTHDYQYEYATKPDFKEIYSSLPQKYIIKCTIGSFNHHIIEHNNLKELTDTCNYLLYTRIPELAEEVNTYHYEPQHQQYKPQIFIEEYIGDNLIDYKFEIIHGKISYLLVKNAWKPDKCVFYNEDGKRIPNLFHLPGETDELKLPDNFDKMKSYCYRIYEITKLPLIRMDFYEINGEIYFSEYTLTPASCRNKISKQSNEYFKKFINI